MIGVGLRKLAEEHGMKVSQGVAYGNLGGFAATMCEGMGYKNISFTFSSNHFGDEEIEHAERIMEQIDDDFLEKNRVLDFEGNLTYLDITFHDDPGTMKCIRRVLDYLLPVMKEAGFQGVEKCFYCGDEIADEGVWKLIQGSALHFHRECVDIAVKDMQAEADQTKRELEWEERKEAESAEIPYKKAGAAAIIGGVAGAVLWFVLESFGVIGIIAAYAGGILGKYLYEKAGGVESMKSFLILMIIGMLSCVTGAAATYIVYKEPVLYAVFTALIGWLLVLFAVFDMRKEDGKVRAKDVELDVKDL